MFVTLTVVSTPAPLSIWMVRGLAGVELAPGIPVKKLTAALAVAGIAPAVVMITRASALRRQLRPSIVRPPESVCVGSFASRTHAMLAGVKRAGAPMRSEE